MNEQRDAPAQSSATEPPVGLHRNAERVQTALAAAGLQAQVRQLTDSARTAAEAAAALGVDIGGIVNSLIFRAEPTAASGEPFPLLVLTSGSHRVDVEHLGAGLGVRLRRADADFVRAATGQPIGGVAPIGHPSPVRTVVDRALAAYPVVWAAAGHPHAVFPTTFDELVRLTGGSPADVVPA
jgi:prolyl-tRNA editing enzyme YbaK/EbsC (Cys-tRNA(Pro) deacylase)